jgi:SAM-dependent methyltransferase
MARRRLTRWDENIAKDWQYVRPPSRPSPPELNIYHRYLSELEPGSSSLMVLGSTPEIRDLAWERGIGTVKVVDYKRRTFDVLTKKMKHRPEKERLIEQDWRELEPSGPFDLILGDLVMNVVPPEDHSELLARVAACLKPTGKFIHREWIQLPPSEFEKVSDLVSHCREKWPKEDLYSALCLPLVSFFFDYERNSVDLQEILDVLEQAFYDKEIDKVVIDAFLRPWGNYRTPNWLLTSADTEEKISEAFYIDHVEHGDGPVSGYCPIYVCKPRVT